MQVLLVEPGKEARPFEMQDALKAMQTAVGGLIQALYPWEDNAALVCNDEGKIIGLPLNRALEDYDVIAGTFFVCGTKGDGFCSLSNEQMEKYKAMFESPELFFRCEVGLVAKKCSPGEYQQAMQERAQRQNSAHKRNREPER